MNKHSPIHIYNDSLHPQRILLCILLLAFFLRIWGIWNASSSDEYNEVFEALKVCSGNLNLERFTKRFFLYILSLEYGIYYLLGWLSHTFHSPLDFATRVVRDLTALFMLGRITSAFFGTASVFMTYLIGKTLAGRLTGLIASLFLCLNVVNIELSHFARVDATLCLCILIAFYYMVKIQCASPAPLMRYYLLAGLFSGIAFQVKVNAIILIIPFLVAHLYIQQEKGLLRKMLNRETLLFGLFFLSGLIAGNPAILLAPSHFLASTMGKAQVYTTPLNEARSNHIGFIAYAIYFYQELGILLSAWCGYSFLRALFSRHRDDILLLSFILPFYLLMGASWYMVSDSYMIPLMPLLYLVASKYLVLDSQKIKFFQKAPGVALTASLAILLVHQTINVIRLELSFSGKNTRVLAKEWIEKNIPPGSKMLMDSGKSINSFAPLIAENRDTIERVLALKKEGLETGNLHDPSKIVDDTALLYYELLLKTVPDTSYDITSTMYGLSLQSLDYYIENSYRYFIISKIMKEKRTSDFFIARSPPEIPSFYKSLDHDKRIDLIKTIAPALFNRGDTFYIYKVITPI